MDEPVKASLIRECDFRRITNGSKDIETSVSLIRAYGNPVDWMTLGSYDLCKRDNLHYWDFSATYKNVFDQEHSRSSVFRIPLVGVEYGNLHGCLTVVRGWICPAGPEDFHFPPEGYKNKTSKCDWKDCRGDGAHLFGDYLPPRNAALYEEIRDMRIEIRSYIKSKG